MDARHGALPEDLEALKPALLAERARAVRVEVELAVEEIESSATEDEIAAEAAVAKTTNVAAFTRKRPARQPFPAHLRRDQRYRSGFPENLGEEFDAPFARLDWIACDTFDFPWHRHTRRMVLPPSAPDAYRSNRDPQNRWITSPPLSPPIRHHPRPSPEGYRSSATWNGAG